VALLCALLTATGHVAGGGRLPDAALLVVLLPLLAGLVTALAGSAATLPRAVAVLGAGQLGLHHLLELLHPVPHAATGAGTGAMLAGHAAATLVTALALRHADAGVAAVAAALRRVVARRLPPPPADRPLPVLAVPGPAVPLRLARALAAAVVRRGPPVERVPAFP
jgi:hypothetical protein